MKRLLALLMIAVFLFALCSCSDSSEEQFHYDNINKYYTNGAKYYKAVMGDKQVEDFGTKYNKNVYDITVRQGRLQYYYAYEGPEQNSKGNYDMKNYIEYLDKTFGYNKQVSESTGMYSYTLDDAQYIYIMKYQMSQNNGMLVMVSVPSNVTATSDDTDSYEYIYSDSVPSNK